MRFESVTSRAFGPFRNETLTLAPGMNVVHGENESGKSSWHAALQASLCGVKRPKGMPTKRMKEFEERRKPWQEAAEWVVEAVVALADGRRVELRQDLAAKSGSARDADIANRDYSKEIEADGMPDGSRWLGLDRASFPATACVRQADMLAVRAGASGLQGALQRAADRADMDTTAGEALKLLADYRKNQIGSEAAPTKPRLLARAKVSDAKRDLEGARGDFARHLDLQRDVKRLEEAVTECQRRIKAVQALRAKEAALREDERIRRMRELNRSVGDGPPVAIDDAAFADQVAATISAWRNAPNPQRPEGETSEVLTGQRSDLMDQVAQVEGGKLGWRPAIGLLVPGLGLLTAGIWCLLASFPSAREDWVPVIGISAVAAGLGAIWWAIARGRRRGKKDREEQLDKLNEAVQSMEDAIARRGEEDSAYQNAVAQRANTRRQLDVMTSAAGLPQSGPDEQVVALGDWQAVRLERLARTAEQTKKWGELQGLMAGLSHQEIEGLAIAKRKEADALLAGCDQAQLQAARSSDDLAALQNEEEEARKRLDNARGALDLFSKGVANVADAEDELNAAKWESERLETLDRTLETTIKFLEQAQDRVHRDMARVLRSTLEDWLPRTTAGRYTECLVDPQTLKVEVRDAQGHWRLADLLSHGTTEQIYLLLRMALCRRLVADGETCPLILDDPVSACDSRRRQSILETLLAISASTQVIVFTHDDDILDWGHRHLREHGNKVIELANPDATESSSEQLGTRIANRFRGGQLETPFDELRGATVRPLDIS